MEGTVFISGTVRRRRWSKQFPLCEMSAGNIIARSRRRTQGKTISTNLGSDEITQIRAVTTE